MHILPDPVFISGKILQKQIYETSDHLFTRLSWGPLRLE